MFPMGMGPELHGSGSMHRGVRALHGPPCHCITHCVRYLTDLPSLLLAISAWKGKGYAYLWRGLGTIHILQELYIQN